MDIGKLDRKATVYSRTAGIDDYGSPTLTSDTIAGYAWVKRINKKVSAEMIGPGFPVEEKNYEFVARYDAGTLKMGRYFKFTGDALKYYIKGVEEIGRQEGMLLTVQTQESRSV